MAIVCHGINWSWWKFSCWKQKMVWAFDRCPTFFSLGGILDSIRQAWILGDVDTVAVGSLEKHV